MQNQINALSDQVRQLQAERTVLQAKLKEAFAAQPAAVDPRELARADDRIKTLQKENDSLRAALAEVKSKPSPLVGPKASDQAKSLEQAQQAVAQANRRLAEQTEKAKELEQEKLGPQKKLASLSPSSANADWIRATKLAVDDANRQLAEQKDLAAKLSLEKTALESRLQTLSREAEAARVLRLENQRLKQQVADAQKARPGAAAAQETARQLTEARAQIALLQSDIEILRVQDTALAAQAKKLSASVATSAAAPAPVVAVPAPAPAVAVAPATPVYGDTTKQLQRERYDLQKKLDAANKELASRKSKAATARIKQMQNEVTSLHARLEVYEARQVPFTAEELALFRRPETKLESSAHSSNLSPVSQLPSGSASLVAEAKHYFAAGQLDKAEARYLEVLRQDDKNAYTLANLAAIQLDQGRLEQAEEHLKSALAVSPDDAYALSIQGYLKFRQAKYDEALSVLSRAAQLDPENAEIQNYLGLTLSEKGLRGPAETALRKAIQIQPAYGEAHNNLAVIYLTQQPPSIELARWHYQKALASGLSRNPDLEKMLAATKSATAQQ